MYKTNTLFFYSSVQYTIKHILGSGSLFFIFQKFIYLFYGSSSSDSHGDEGDGG